MAKWTDQGEETAAVTEDSVPSVGPDENPVKIISTQPSSARVYDYLMGGDDNFAVDRAWAERVATEFGGMDKARAGQVMANI